MARMMRRQAEESHERAGNRVDIAESLQRQVDRTMQHFPLFYQGFQEELKTVDDILGFLLSPHAVNLFDDANPGQLKTEVLQKVLLAAQKIRHNREASTLR